MSYLTVNLSTDLAEEQWGSGALLSFAGNSATIHLDESLSPDQQRARIQCAARKLEAMNLPGVELAGPWEKEQQWAFGFSYYRPRQSSALVWADNEDKNALADRYESLLFCRDVVNATPEDLSPEALAKRATEWLTGLSSSITVTSWVGEELQAQGWTGIYNVGRGSVRPPVMLEVDYNPTGDADALVSAALVGKGITFDSGGYSIKSSEGMLDMKCDMGGAATVTSALGYAIMQGLSTRVKLYLCCAENLISGHAYKLGDVLTYKNGTSVEIVNTDAEGRLVLADGLIAATETGAKTIIDAATLTGAAVAATGGDYNAVFSLDQTALDDFIAEANLQDEPVWPLPLTAAHKDKCPSHFADTANSRAQKGGGAGGASNAAGFLSRFVGNNGQGWIHVDLAAAYNASGTNTMPAGASGIGFRAIAATLLKS